MGVAVKQLRKANKRDFYVEASAFKPVTREKL
jgi:hypothetical protein